MSQMRDRQEIRIVESGVAKSKSGNLLDLVECPACKETRVALRTNTNAYGHTFCKGCAKVTDIKGSQYGRLTVIKYSHKETKPRNGFRHYWLCKCNCGATKPIEAHGLTSGLVVSCGCYHMEILNSFKGTNHPAYKHDLDDDERERRRAGRNTSNPRYTKWRTEVYERDGYTCQACGMGGKLVAHHIDSWKSHESLRFTVDNGVTLCVSCHKSFHHDFGIRNNSRSQFDQWMLATTPSQYLPTGDRVG